MPSQRMGLLSRLAIPMESSSINPLSFGFWMTNRNQSRADASGLRLVDLHEKIRDRDFLLQQSLFAGVSYNGVQHFFIAFDAVLPWIRTHDRSLFLPDLAIPGKV